jgi:hypothetical protein
VEYKQDEEDDEDDDERIDYPERNDVPAPLPLVRQNASAPVAHLEDNDFITLSDTEYITIPAAGDDNFIKNTRVNRFEFVEGQVN